MAAMPSRPAKPAPKAPPPAEDEALPDPFDQHDTAQDHAAPPPVNPEVELPDELAPADAPPVEQPEPEPAPAPVPSASGRSAVSARKPAKGASARSPAATRSSRRAAAASATSAAAPKVSSRRVATPVDRGPLQKALLWTGLSILIAAILVTGLILWVNYGKADRTAARDALEEVGRQVELVKSALSKRRGTDARKAYEAALKLLTGTPQLGGAVAMPSEEKPVVRESAVKAYELKGEVEKLNERIVAVEAENAADANLTALKTRFGTLSEPATDLDALEKDVLAFMENPVDPKAGPSPANAQTFARLAGEAKLRLANIASERDRRKKEAVATPLSQAAVEADGLCQQERFGEALAKIAEFAEKHRDADFNPLKAQVEDAAEKGWRSAKNQVENHLTDWKNPGTAEGNRKAALAKAKERLNQVIERFGIPTYVDQARTLLTPLP